MSDVDISTPAPRPAGNPPGSGGRATYAERDLAYAAFMLLRIGFVALPLLMGLDKFFNLMTQWTTYLAPWIVNIIPFDAGIAMKVVGVVEIIAAILVALKPRYAAWIVSLWLAGIIINLLTYSGYYDVALRDFGLLVAAVALALLAHVYDPPLRRASSTH